MNPEHEHFAELATRTLTDHPDLRVEARAELLGRLAHGRAAVDTVTAAAERLAKREPRSWLGRTAILSAIALLMLAMLAGFLIRAAWPELKVLPAAADWNGATRQLILELTEDDRRFFAADLYGSWVSRTSELDSVLAELSNQYPGEPGFLELRSYNHIRNHGTIPEGIRETAAQIDPGNGLWAVIEAGALAITDSAAGSRSMEQADADVLAAVGLLEQALATERLESHLPGLAVRRLERLPEMPATAVGNDALAHFSTPLHANRVSGSLEASGLPAVFFLRAGALEMAGDREGLRNLIGIWRAFCRRWVKDSKSIQDVQFRLRPVFIGVALADAADRLGMADEARSVRETVERVRAAAPFAIAAGGKGIVWPADDRPMSLALRRGGGRWLPENPTAADFEPGRKAEHLAAERFFSLAGALMLLPVLAGVWLESFRRGRRVNGLADGLNFLFSRADSIRVIAVGVIIPLLLYGLISRATPLSGHAIGIGAAGPGHPWIPMVATWLLSLVLVVQMVRAQFRRRLGFLGLGGRWQAIGWVVAAMTALIVPLAGLGHGLSISDGKPFSIGLAAACGITVLWLLWRAGAAVFSPAATSLGRVLAARRLLLSRAGVSCSWCCGCRCCRPRTPGLARIGSAAASVLRAESPLPRWKPWTGSAARYLPPSPTRLARDPLPTVPNRGFLGCRPLAGSVEAGVSNYVITLDLKLSKIYA